MNPWQSKVRDFVRHLGRDASPAPPAVRDGELRAAVVLEEAMELAVALCGRDAGFAVIEEVFGEVREKKKCAPNRPDVVEAIDGVCDVVITALGTAEAIGVDLEPHFDAVHAANMEKLPRTIDRRGKAGYKPPGWRDPKADIAEILLDQALDERHPVVHGETLDACASHRVTEEE